MLIDASVGLQDNDKILIDMLTEMQKPFILVMTKSDKLGKEGGKDELESKIENVKVFIQGAGSLCIPVLHLVSSYAQ